MFTGGNCIDNRNFPFKGSLTVSLFGSMWLLFWKGISPSRTLLKLIIVHVFSVSIKKIREINPFFDWLVRVYECFLQQYHVIHSLLPPGTVTQTETTHRNRPTKLNAGPRSQSPPTRFLVSDPVDLRKIGGEGFRWRIWRQQFFFKGNFVLFSNDDCGKIGGFQYST